MPDLARNLNHLGGNQHALGQRGAALASAQEAVDIYRKLAEQRPDTFLPKLMDALSNLAADHVLLNRYEDARVLAQEAFDLYWTLDQQHPQAFHDRAVYLIDLLRALHKDLGIPLDPTTASRIAAFEAKDPEHRSTPS